jgi:hypothetical protein
MVATGGETIRIGTGTLAEVKWGSNGTHAIAAKTFAQARKLA